MAADLHAVHTLIERFLDAYGEDLVKQLRELRFYPNQAAAVDRLLGDKDDLITRIGALRNAPVYRLPASLPKEAYSDFLFQVEGLVRRRIHPHLEEFRKLISETQLRSAYRNRMSWESVKVRLNHLGQLADELSAALRDYFRLHFLPELPADAAPSVASVNTAAPAAATLRPFSELLAAESPAEADAQVYDQALSEMEKWLGKEQGSAAKGFALLAARMREGVGDALKGLFPAVEGYQAILKPGYVSLDEFRTLAEPYEKLGTRMRNHLEATCDGRLKPLEYEGTDAEGQPRRRTISYARLFRNLDLHVALLRLIRQDVYYDVAYYLYYRPAWEHWHQLKLMLDKAVLPRVPLRERYNPELKLTGHLFNELKSQLDVFHAQLRRHF